MTATSAGISRPPRPPRSPRWLRGSPGGLFLLAAAAGVASGAGAVAFRDLISLVTWLATGHSQFGQQGWLVSAHLPWLGLGFFVLIPVAGGLLYGPLIYRFAREARGHGVPEVLTAVAEDGSRLRPRLSLVKGLASALCIGTGGSLGREGPMVQIGSSLASGLGQWARVPENRLRILVACGTAGGISGVFNAPVTGAFFGIELILRAFSIDALIAVMLSAMVADSVAEPLLGSKRLLPGFPAGVAAHHLGTYLLVGLLAVLAALVGLAFKTVLHKTEDICDRLWRGRPEWARPAAGGLALGVLLLGFPQMYGGGYAVMDSTVAGGYALWFVALLAFGKIAATSLSVGIGGSGGTFAPSLFIGLTSGMAFGDIARHLFGPGAGQPVLYAAVAMGAVLAATAHAPLTSVASAVEMTGDLALALPALLAVAIATALSRTVSAGTIYTTKLLRAGIDIDRPTRRRPQPGLNVATVIHPLRVPPPAAGPQHFAAGVAPPGPAPAGASPEPGGAQPGNGEGATADL